MNKNHELDRKGLDLSQDGKDGQVELKIWNEQASSSRERDPWEEERKRPSLLLMNTSSPFFMMLLIPSVVFLWLVGALKMVHFSLFPTNTFSQTTSPFSDPSTLWQLLRATSTPSSTTPSTTTVFEVEDMVKSSEEEGDPRDARDGEVELEGAESRNPCHELKWTPTQLNRQINTSLDRIYTSELRRIEEKSSASFFFISLEGWEDFSSSLPSSSSFVKGWSNPWAFLKMEIKFQWSVKSNYTYQECLNYQDLPTFLAKLHCQVSKFE